MKFIRKAKRSAWYKYYVLTNWSLELQKHKNQVTPFLPPKQPLDMRKRKLTLDLIKQANSSMMIQADNDSQLPYKELCQHPSLSCTKTALFPLENSLWKTLSNSIINSVCCVGFQQFQNSQCSGPPTSNLTAIWMTILLDTATLFEQNEEVKICHIHHPDKIVSASRRIRFLHH